MTRVLSFERDTATGESLLFRCPFCAKDFFWTLTGFKTGGLAFLSRCAGSDGQARRGLAWRAFRESDAGLCKAVRKLKAAPEMGGGLFGSLRHFHSLSHNQSLDTSGIPFLFGALFGGGSVYLPKVKRNRRSNHQIIAKHKLRMR